MLAASPFKIRLTCAIAGLLCGIVQGGKASEPLFRRQTETCMGTKWHIALYADDEKSANTAFSLAWDEIHAIDRCLTNYAADSELNQFCRNAPHEQFIKVSEHLATVLRAATNVSQLSDGYFDVTIGPVASLWRRARAKKQLPDPKKLAAARKRVNFQFVQFGNDKLSMRISSPDVRIDLGGIAKGYAVDRAIQIARNVKGVNAVLVNGGGDLAAFGVTPKSDGWAVDIARLGSKGESQKLVLKDNAIATSGDAWQYLQLDGKRYSHLIDPKTGIGSTRRLSVSVIAPTCMQADALASALSVMPIDKATALIESLDSVDAALVKVSDDSNMQETRTTNFPALR